jgi:hypothetical protein
VPIRVHSWLAGRQVQSALIFSMIELPQRPQRSSRAMLVFCAIVFVALSGILLFLNRAGAQKKE